VSLTTIAALKTGDCPIFEEVFHENYERVYFYVLKKTKAAYIAEEVTQLTFIKLWQYREKLDENIALNIQLFRIARTTMIDLLRKQQNSNYLLANAENIYKQSSNDVWEAVTAKELKGRLILSIQSMPAVRKKVFEMSRVNCMSNREIAIKLSISVKAVEFHITQALKYLKQILSVIIIFLRLT